MAAPASDGSGSNSPAVPVVTLAAEPAVAEPASTAILDRELEIPVSLALTVAAVNGDFADSPVFGVDEPVPSLDRAERKRAGTFHGVAMATAHSAAPLQQGEQRNRLSVLAARVLGWRPRASATWARFAPQSEGTPSSARTDRGAGAGAGIGVNRARSFDDLLILPESDAPVDDYWLYDAQDKRSSPAYSSRITPGRQVASSHRAGDNATPGAQQLSPGGSPESTAASSRIRRDHAEAGPAGSAQLMDSGSERSFAAPQPQRAGHGTAGPNRLLNYSFSTGAAVSPPAAAMGTGQWRAKRLFKLADLERVGVLGRGFFSEVALVVDRRTGDKYALKSIKEFKDVNSRMTFVQETEMLRLLHHPNILRLRGVFVNQTGLHVLTDYMEHGTLRKLLKSKTVALNNHDKVRLALDIAAGMRYLHDHHVMHRDLKSKNCLLTQQRRVVIGDFGFARHIPSPLAQSTDQAGTAYWMAPEMLRGKEYGLPVDVFSFGIVLCEILTRRKAVPTEEGIPRLPNFGVDEAGLKALTTCCPAELVDLALDCCRIEPGTRPVFGEIEDRLVRLNWALESASATAAKTEAE